MSAPALAAASERLKGKPGRPRKQPASADAVKTPKLQLASVSPTTPRLMDLASGARYMSVSIWTLRDLIANGTLRRVQLAMPGGRDLRRVLLDVRDLDALVERSKEPAP
jgi:hypothetical protein